MTRPSHWSRLLAPLSLVVLVAGLGNTPYAMARPVTTSLIVPLSGTTSYAPDSCLPAGDVVTFFGEIHLVSRVVMRSSAILVELHANAADVQGVGASGLTYEGAGAVRLSFSALPLSTTVTFRIAPPEPCPVKPLVIRLGLTFDADGGLSAATSYVVTNGIIVYASVVSGNEQIFTIHPDGTSNTQITSASGSQQYGLPAWNATGTKLLVNYTSGSTHEIHEMSATGAGEIVLITNAQAGQFSADGTKIAFIRPNSAATFFQVPGAGDIWTASYSEPGGVPTVSNLVQLTASSSSQTYGAPSWSNDGIKIAYVNIHASSCVGGGSFCPEAWTMNSDGSGQTRLVPPLYDAGLGHIAPGASVPFWRWRPTEILFEALLPGTDFDGRVWKINSDGTSPTQLTTQADTTQDGIPQWSPDGTKIVYLHVTAGGVRQYFTMNADGSNQTLLISPCTEGYYSCWAAWQPQ